MRILSFVLLIFLAVPTVEATCFLRNRTVYQRKVIVRRRVVVQREIILVPQVVLQEVQRDHYYSVGDQQYQELLIQAAMARLMMYGGQRMPPAVDPPAQRFAPKNVPIGPVKIGSFQDPKLVSIVKDSCAKCHGVGSPNSTLMVDGKLADISEGLAWKAFGLVNAGKMPKASEALKDDKVTPFYDWAEAQKGKK